MMTAARRMKSRHAMQRVALFVRGRVALVRAHRIRLRRNRIDLKPMPHRLPAELAAHAIAERDELGARELDELARLHADHEVARRLAVDELVVRLLRIEERLRDDARV